MLQFCQECEIYHNVSYLNGDRVINQCESKIQENLTLPSSESTADVVYFNRQDYQPLSRASFTSIIYHGPTSTSKNSQARLNQVFSIAQEPKKSPINIVFGGKPQNIHLNRPLPLFIQTNSGVIGRPMGKPPSIMINYGQSREIKYTEFSKQQPLLLNPTRNIPIPPPSVLKVKSKVLLSTIKEQSYNEYTSRSRSVQSNSNSTVKSKLAMNHPPYVFKQIQKRQLIWPFVNRQDKENNCCCW